MKSLFLFLALFCFNSLNAQLATDPLYVTFEFMKVDEEHDQDYLEIENFWKGIHQQRVQNGDIVGWNLWSLKPGGSEQGYQYLVVTAYKSASEMMSGQGKVPFSKLAQMAHPKMTKVEIDAMFKKTAMVRDLAQRLYLVQIDATENPATMNLGAVAQIDFMNALTDKYETMESMIFKPWHQSLVDKRVKSRWDLFRVLFPAGSNRLASHITTNVFKNMDDFVKSIDYDFSDDNITQDIAVKEGEKTRDHREVLLATLIMVVR